MHPAPGPARPLLRSIVPSRKISLRANGDDARATLELFAPLAQNDRTLLFADLRVNARTGDSEGGGSVGVGLRRILNPDIMVGGYLAYDVVDSEYGGTFESLAFGAELLTRDHDFRLKFSEALSDPALIGRTILPEAGAIVIDSGRIFEQRPTLDFEQTPFDSIEAEFGARISALDLPTGHEFRVYAAAYNLSADNFDAEIGTRGRFEYRVDDAFGFDGARFILGGGVSEDRFRDTEVFGEVRFRMPLTALFGGAARPAPDRDRTPLYQRMTERVARDGSPVLRSTQRGATVEQAVRNPFSGEAIDKVVYVDAAGDGDGSRIDPTSLDGSIPLAGENGVILVDGAGGAVETGGVALERGQQVVGAGGTVYVVRSDGALVEVDSGLTGPAVVRGTDAANAVFTLADNTLVRGLTIEGGLSGLAAQDIRRFQVSDVTVQGSAGDGLSLVGLVDTAFIEGLTITGAGADGAAISGVEGALVVDGLTVTGAAGDGVSVSGSDGAILFEDLVIDGAGVTGNGLVAQSVSGVVGVDGGRIENVAEDGVRAVDANLSLNAMTIVAGAGEAIDVTAGDAEITLSFSALTLARAGAPAPASTAAPTNADAGSSGRADAVWTPAQTPVTDTDPAAPGQDEADAAGARPASPEALETADFRGVENLDSRRGAAAHQPGVTPAPAGPGAVSRETFDVGLVSEAEPVAQTLSVQSAAPSTADEGASVTTPVSAPESAPGSGSAAPAPFEPRRPDAPDQMNAHAVVTLTRREPASGAGAVTALDTPDPSVLTQATEPAHGPSAMAASDHTAAPAAPTLAASSTAVDRTPMATTVSGRALAPQASAPGAILSIDGSTGPGAVTIVAMRDLDLAGGLGETAGVVVHQARFGLPQSGVAAGAWTVGRSDARIGGEGLSFTEVSGLIAFDDLDLFTDGGDGFVAEGGVGDGLSIWIDRDAAADARIDAVGGAALRFTELHTLSNIAELNASGGHHGLELALVAGAFDVAGGALSTATGHGVLFAGWADVSLSGLTIDGAASGVEAGLGEGADFSLGASTITARGAGAAGVRVQSVGSPDATARFFDLSIDSAGIGLAALSPSASAAEARLTVTGFDDIEIVSAEGFGAALQNVVLAAPDGGAFSAAAVDGYGLVVMDSDGTLGLESVSVSDAAMDGVVVMGGSGVLGLGDVSVSGAGGQGLRVAGHDGALGAGSVSITDSGGTGLAIAAGDGAVTLGDVTVTGAGADAVVIGGSGAGSVTAGRITVSDFGAYTALDLSGFDLAGGLVTGAVTLTGDGVAGSLGIDLDGAINGRRIQLGAVEAPDTDTPSAISGVDTGVRLGDADVNFSFGDAEGVVDAASTIEASGILIDFTGLDPDVGTFDFTDVTFIGDVSQLAGQLDADVFFVDSTAGSGARNDPGTLAQAEMSGADVIILINDGTALDVSGTNGDDTFTLQAGQRVAGFGQGDITGLSGIAGAPANILLSTVEARTEFTVTDPTGNGAATVSGGAGSPVITLADSVLLQGFDVAASGAGVAAIAGADVTGVVLDGLTVSAAGTGLDIDIDAAVTGALTVRDTTILSTAGRAMDIAVSNAGAAFSLSLDALALTGADAVRLSGAGGASLEITALDGLALTGAGLTASDAAFSVTGGGMSVGAGGVRATGAGLSLNSVTGALSLDEVSVLNTGGAGVRVDNSALAVGDFTFATAGGSIDTMAGAALDLDRLTTDLTLGAMTAAGGANGLRLNAVAGALDVTTTSLSATTGAGILIADSGLDAAFTDSVSVTGAGGSGIVLSGALGDIAFGATTVSAVGAGTGVDLSGLTSGSVAFDGVAVSGLGAGGTGVDLTGVGSAQVDFGGLDIDGGGAAGTTGVSLSGAGFSGAVDTGALSISAVTLGVDLTNAAITGAFTAGDGSNQDADGAASAITLSNSSTVLAISGLDASRGVYDFRDVVLTGDTSNLVTNLTLFYASAGGSGAGTASDFGSLSDAETAGADVVVLVNDGAALDAAGTNGDDTFTLGAGQRLVSFANGDVTLGGAAPANVLLFGIDSGTIADPTGNGAATLSSASNTVTLGGGNTVLGVNLVSTGGAALTGSGFGDLSLSFSTLTGGAGGALLDATGGAGLVRVEDSVFAGAGASGFALTGITGSTLIFERNTVSSTGAFAFSASAAAAADLTLASFADNTATGGLGGFSFDTLTFGSGAAADAGALTIGTSSARVAGTGLSLQGVAGALSVANLQAFTNGGAGVFIDNSALSAGDFTFTASGGAVDALTGAALDLDTATLDLTLSTVTASGGANGIAFDQIAGQAAVTGATTVSSTSGDAVSITNSAATLGLDALTLTGAGADGLGVTRSSGDLTVSGALTIDAATAAGVRFTDNTGDIVFNGAVAISDTGVVGLSSETVGGAATGSVTFTDTVTLSTGAATAVSLAAGSLAFSGGLDIDTTSGTGLQTTGGVLSIANAGDESVTTVTGSALSLQDVAVGAAGLHLDRVAVTGTANGAGAALAQVDTSAGAVTIDSLAIAGATGAGLSLNTITGANGVSITAADIANTGTDGVLISGAASLVNLGTGSANGLSGLSVDGAGANGVQVDASSGVVNIATGSAALNLGTDTVNGGGALVVGGANAAAVTIGNGAVQGTVAAGGSGIVLGGGAGGVVTLRNITASDTASANGTVTVRGAGAVTLDDLIVTGANTHAFSIENSDAVVTATDLSASGFAGSGLFVTDDDTDGSVTQTGTLTLAAPGTAGITIAGSGTVSLGDVDITGLTANTTGVDLTGAAGAVTFATLDITGVSTTGTVGIDYSNSNNALDVLTTDSGTIQGVGVGVDLTNAAGAGEFQFGDGSNIDMDGAASVIDAVIPITAAGLGAAGEFDFLDVALTGDISAFESTLEFFYVDADGADGASPFAAGTEQNPGSIGQAQASGADIIILVDTTAGTGEANADTIDLADATLGAGGTFTLATGQQLFSFLNTDTLDFSSAGGGAPSNLFLQGVTVGIIDNPNAGFGAPNLTTSAAGADTLVLADNIVVQGVRLTATSGAGVAVSGSGVTNVRIADSLIAGAAGAFSLRDAAGATELGLFEGVTLSALGGTLVDFDGTGGNGFAVRSFSSSTLSGGGAAGAVFNSVAFDADGGAAGAQTVNAGAWTLGTSLNRISGAGLSMTAVTGDLSFTALDIFNDGGAGLQVDNAGQAVSDFSLGVAGGAIDTTNGAALALDTLTSDVTLGSITSTNAAGASAVSLTDATGRFTVTGATTVSNAGIHGIVLDDIDGADMVFDTVSVTGAGVDGLRVGAAATGTVEFTGAVTIDLQPAGDDAMEFVGYDGSVLFNAAVALANAGDEGFIASGDADFNFLSTLTISDIGDYGMFLSDAGGAVVFADTVDIGSVNSGILVRGASGTLDFATLNIGDFSADGLVFSSANSLNASFDALNITGPGGLGVSGSFGDIDIASGLIQADGAPAISLIAGSSVTLTSAAQVTATSNEMLRVDRDSSTVTFEAGASFTATGGTGVQFTDADGSYTFNDTVSVTGNNDDGVFMDSASSGSATFNDLVTLSTGTGTAIDLDAGSLAFTGGLDIDTTSGAGIDADGGTLSMTGVNTIDGVSGASAAVAINNATASLSGLSIGGAGAVNDGIAITLDSAAAHAVSLSDVTVSSLGDGIGVAVSGTANHEFSLSGATLAADGAAIAIAIDSSAAATAGLTITDFSGITVTGDGADNGGVILTGNADNPIVFDADTGTAGFQAVSGGAGVIGITANRVIGDALSFTNVEGALSFDDLDIANDGGFGIEVNNAAVVGGKDFTFNVDAGGAADASVDTTNGAALFLDPLTVNMVFDTITASGGANGVVLDEFAGSFQVAGTTTISDTTGAGLVFSGANTGTATFTGLTTIATPGTAGMEIGATGGVSFGDVAITGLGDTTTGLDLTGVSGAVGFTSLDITGASTTDTTGIDLSGAATADDITIAEADISGVALGVDLDTAAITGTFRLGDGDGDALDSEINATRALSIAGLDQANGTYDFADVNFGASDITNLQTDVYWAAESAQGTGDGSSATNAGTLASAAAASAGNIVLLDTAGSGGQDVITGTITLDAAQSLYSFGSGDTLTGLGGAPANLLLTGITSGTVTNPFTGSGGVRLTSADGTATVTAGDGSTLAGLEIFNTGTGAALLANGAAGLTLDGVTLSASSGDGASLTDLTGAVSFTDVTVAMTGGSGHGFDFDLASAPSITFDGVTVTTSGAHSGDAVSAAVSGGFAPTVSFANANVFRGGSNGFVLTTADSADSVVLDFDSATTLQGLDGAALSLDGFDGTTDTITVTGFAGITVDSAFAASGRSGGLIFADLQFDSDTDAAGLQALTGDLSLGAAAGDIDGVGLSLINVRGVLDLGVLTIENDGGTALIVDNSGAAAADFTLNTASGVIDAVNDTALQLNTLTLGMTLDSLVSRGGTNGVGLNAFAGGLQVTGTTSVGGTSGYGIALTGANTGTATFGGQVTIENDFFSAGGGVNLDSGTLIFNGGLEIETRSGIGFDGDGGTLAVADAAIETITTETGQIITLNGVTLAAGGVSFDTLAASGIVAGEVIALSSVGGAGSFDGGAATIAETSGSSDGIYISSASADVNFDSATIDDTDRGIVMRLSSGDVTFGTVDIDGTNLAVELDLASGSGAFTINGGAIGADATNATGLLIDNDGDVLIAADITHGGAGAAIDIGNRAGVVSLSGDLSITGGAGDAFIADNVDNIDLTLSGNVSITGGTGDGFLFSNNDNSVITLSGDISITGGTGAGFLASSNRDSQITISGDIAMTSAGGDGFVATSNSDSVFALSGASKVFSTGDANAVRLSSNSGSTFNFTGGGLDIDTTSGTGFSATSGATAVTVQGAGNTINTATGQVIDLSNMTIGAGGMAFDALAASGIVADDALSFGNVVGAGTFSGGAVSVAGTSAGGHGLSLGGGSGVSYEFASATIDSTSGAGISLNSTNSAVSFTTVDIDGTTGDGVDITYANGAVTISGGAIGSTNDPAGIGVDINGGAAAITIGASLTKTTAGDIMEISNRTGGTVTLSGNVSATGGLANGIDISNNSGGAITLSGASKTLSTGANTAVNLASNTGATINLTGGGLDIDTTTGTGFNATGGGGVTVQGANNTVTATTGTAVNIADTMIGAAGVTLRSVAANGAASGIVLDATGSSGFFSVTGDGSTPSRGGNGSGGTIQNSTGDGISLTDATDVSLAHMTIRDGAVHGIDATGVNGLVLDGVTLDGNGDANEEHGVRILNGAGVYDFSQLLADGNFDAHVRMQQQSGATSLTSITIDDSTFQNVTTGFLEDGVTIELLDGSSAGTVTVSNSTFSNHDGDHVQVSLNGSASIGTTTVSGNTMTANASNLAGGLTFSHGGIFSGTHDLVISNNTVQGANVQSINVNVGAHTGTANVTASITGNMIGTAGVADSGGFVGIDAEINGNPAGSEAGVLTVLIDNNTIRETTDQGISLAAVDGDSNAATLNATVTRNIVTEALGGGAPFAAMFIDSQNGNTICVDIGGAGLENTFESTGFSDIAFRTNSGAVINVEGYGGASNSAAPLRTYLQGRNTDTPNVEIQPNAGTIQGGGACPAP